jgi:hypothetical protein
MNPKTTNEPCIRGVKQLPDTVRNNKVIEESRKEPDVWCAPKDGGDDHHEKCREAKEVA